MRSFRGTIALWGNDPKPLVVLDTFSDDTNWIIRWAHAPAYRAVLRVESQICANAVAKDLIRITAVGYQLIAIRSGIASFTRACVAVHAIGAGAMDAGIRGAIVGIALGGVPLGTGAEQVSQQLRAHQRATIRDTRPAAPLRGLARPPIPP